MLSQTHNKAGFTLIEVVIVFAIMASIAGVGVASFLNYSKEQRVKQTVEDIITTVERAKFSAQSRVKPNGCMDTLIYYNFEIDNAPTPQIYKLVARCGVNDIPIFSKKLNTNLEYTDIVGCKSIIFNVLSGSIECKSGGSPELSFILSGYNGGYKEKLSVDKSGNTKIE